MAHTNTADQLGQQLERAKLGVYHHMSRPHLQRHVDEVVFRWNQRTITSDCLSRGRPKERRVPKPFLEQLSVLFKRAICCELRRARRRHHDTGDERKSCRHHRARRPNRWASLGLDGFELMPMANA
jgi:hypothetical protein